MSTKPGRWPLNHPGSVACGSSIAMPAAWHRTFAGSRTGVSCQNKKLLKAFGRLRYKPG